MQSNSPKRRAIYQIKKVSSVLSAFEAAIAILEEWGGKEEVYCWFRGVKSNKLALLPGAYWRYNYDERGPLIDLCQQGVRFAKVENIDTWGTYYLAQHHGIPTRLLDWSESFISSCFFAFDGATNSDIPCVWILNPTEFNKMVCGWEGLPCPEYSTKMHIWLPSRMEASAKEVSTSDLGTATYDNELPIAIYPRQDNERIQSQKGFFTVHGRKRLPIDKVIKKNHPDPQRVLARIDFQRCNKKVAIKQLELLGTRRSSIYPDIDNFIKELKESHKW